MEWNVKNAVNPNVERQHLNKILKEISGSYADVNARLTAAAEGLGNVQSGLTTTITKVINNTLPAGDLATQVTLTGDVVGTSTKVPGQNAVTINTVLSGSYVGEAPIDGNIYWRFQGGWQQVPDAVANLATLPDNGYLVIDENGVYQSRSIVSADEVNIVVTNGDGNLGDTTINLAEVPDDGTGVLQLTSFDIYGRKTGTAEATTDDLPEGTTNLYWKEAPIDGEIYGRKDAEWVVVEATGGFVPYFIPDGQIFFVPIYQQALYSQVIELDGDGMIVVEGMLIEVN